MNCPVCNVGLTMMERQGVEIDYCPKCRGVWLDRGELDKIIDRSSGGSEYGGNEPYDERDRYSEKGGYDRQPHRKHKRREGFLSDLFDFD
ncbi:MAG TPA: zf-TFIIB domain-containing protein [Blastocatellia bacterium]|nr:zf-TFIIB domain-containing protein [Blastocatellia bacterium]